MRQSEPQRASPRSTETDVLLWEGDASDPTLKPPEMYTLIENFCLGLRRLEIFGRARTVRRGWVTALADGEEDRIEEGMTLGADDGTGDADAETGSGDALSGTGNAPAGAVVVRASCGTG